MTPNEITERIRSLAFDARSTADDGMHEDMRACVVPLADALDQAADVLDSQQRFLIDLRNHKADAGY